MKNLQPLLFILFISSLALFFSLGAKDFILQYFKIDSIGHFIGFFSLTWLLNSLLKLPLLNLTVTLFIYSALTEVGQHYLGFRNGEFRDFVADMFGILTFLSISWIIASYAKKRQYEE